MNAHQCPECMNVLVDDVHTGEVICSGCGMVVVEQTENRGPETADIEDRMRLARATGHATLAQHDMGIATGIFLGQTDFSGKHIGRQMVEQMKNIRRWQNRIRVHTPYDRRLINILSNMTEMCNGLSLPKTVLETASMIYRTLDKTETLKGKSVASISAAVVYMACKQCTAMRTMEEICATVCESKEIKSKTKLANRYYREMVFKIGSRSTPAIGMNMYISQIANKTGTDVRVERLAHEIADKTKDNRNADGKAPNGIAAAYLHIASTLMGQKISQRSISVVAGVTEVTMRNRCKDIMSSYRFTVTLRPLAGQAKPR